MSRVLTISGVIVYCMRHTMLYCAIHGSTVFAENVVQTAHLGTWRCFNMCVVVNHASLQYSNLQYCIRLYRFCDVAIYFAKLPRCLVLYHTVPCCMHFKKGFHVHYIVQILLFCRKSVQHTVLYYTISYYASYTVLNEIIW